MATLNHPRLNHTEQVFLNLTFPTQDSGPIVWGQLYGSAFGLVIARAVQQHSGVLLVITPDTPAALRLEQEVKFYSDKDLAIQVFPDWETLPYDPFSPHEEIISQRIELLTTLQTLQKGVVIIAVSTLVQRLAPPEFLTANCFMFSKGQTLDIDQFRKRLDSSGYHCVPEVNSHGEFAIRGSLIDLFPMGSTTPYRIDLFDNEIESIRSFDTESQRTLELVDSIRLMPAREFPLDEAAISLFRTQYRKIFEGDPNRSQIYRDISRGLIPTGIEYYLHLFFTHTSCLFDYLAPNTLALIVDGSLSAAESFALQIQQRYEQRRHDVERPLLTPDKVFLSSTDLQTRINLLPQIHLQHFEPVTDNNTTQALLGTRVPPAVQINTHTPNPLATLEAFLEQFSGQVCIVAESTGRREFILDLLKGRELRPNIFAHWQDFFTSREKFGIVVAPLELGLALDSPPLCVITETQLFGTRAHKQYARKRRSQDTGNLIQALTDLSVGTPVVHTEHGVGRFLGLTLLDVDGQKAEFLNLEYADQDKLYVPVASLHLISRFSGASPENAPLHKLGTSQWQTAKRKASKRIQDVAAQLLEIYARRSAQTRQAYTQDDNDYHKFVSTFPFEETPDQATAIESVLADMHSDKPMDRVICGDVGFGKTEVAMRAVFIAVQSGYQVAILVPTTLLAQQHYQNFLDRFADWPVKIEVLSRFRSKQEAARVIEDLSQGRVDIMVGTHKLLQKDVRFKNLGLLVLDEEHRFGVQQKERFKALRAKVDILTLTATPIPRTLNMSLAGLRDLSIISTPPVARVAIKTFVSQWNDTLIQEAILREIKRGGQVFFVHNKVDTIERTQQTLARLVPEAEIRHAHGQMRERELEQIMLDFYHQRFNVLVCTTIIESGIDVPTANTMIVDRADHFGLSQLHQLRGRVGRSHHRAYAYLIVPERQLMTADAVKRLQAIESLEDLGAGFMLATHDLEIRGAGELLGDEQSGEIQEIGFGLYNEMLEHAVTALKAGKIPNVDLATDTSTEIELGISALIDSEYLPDIHTRLVLYKRIASANSDAALRELQVEMIDRFGLLTDNIKNLFAVTALKLKASACGVRKITANDAGARIHFTADPPINSMQLLRMIQTENRTYKLEGPEKLRVFKDLTQPAVRVDFLTKLLDSISAA